MSWVGRDGSWLLHNYVGAFPKRATIAYPDLRRGAIFGGMQSCLKVLRRYESQEQRGYKEITHSHLVLLSQKLRSQLCHSVPEGIHVLYLLTPACLCNPQHASSPDVADILITKTACLARIITVNLSFNEMAALLPRKISHGATSLRFCCVFFLDLHHNLFCARVGLFTISGTKKYKLSRILEKTTL